MTQGSFSSFSHAAQQAQQWVNEVEEELGCGEARALQLLRSVLQTLRDFMSHEEAADLAAQLPTMIRGLFFEGWNPTATPVKHYKKLDFLLALENRVGMESAAQLDRAVASVFGLLEKHVSCGEVAQIRRGLKKSLRRLWPSHDPLSAKGQAHPPEAAVVRALP